MSCFSVSLCVVPFVSSGSVLTPTAFLSALLCDAREVASAPLYLALLVCSESSAEECRVYWCSRPRGSELALQNLPSGLSGWQGTCS